MTQEQCLDFAPPGTHRTSPTPALPLRYGQRIPDPYRPRAHWPWSAPAPSLAFPSLPWPSLAFVCIPHWPWSAPALSLAIVCVCV